MQRFTLACLWITLSCVSVVSAQAPGDQRLASEIMQSINQERVKRQLAPLQSDLTLQELTDQWADRLARLNRMEHRKNLSALQKANHFSYLNENLYKFSAVPDASRVVKAWMNSRGHRRNLLAVKAEVGAVSVGFTRQGGTIVVFQGAARVSAKSRNQNLSDVIRKPSSLGSKSR